MQFLSTERLYDVIVVGAGLSGLSAAHQLGLAGKSVLVLEASKRIGGRIYSQWIDGLPIDLGAQWIGPSYRNLLELCHILDLNIDEKKHEGQDFYALNGSKNFFSGPYPQDKIRDRINTSRLIHSLDKTKIPHPEKPWQIPKAQKLDQQRFGQFLKQKAIGNRYFKVIYNIFESRFLNGINHVSALEAINNWHACSFYEKWRIQGGMDQLVKKLAQELDVQTQQPVQTILKEGHLLKINTTHDSYRSRYIIVATPPLQAAQIRYEPSPGVRKEKIWDHAEAGRIIKTILIFSRPFWQDGKWSGQAFFSEEYPFNSLVDISQPDTSYGILACHTIGIRCLRLEPLSDAERIDLMLSQINSILNTPSDAKLEHGLTHDWKAPPNGPGAFHVFPPGTLTTFGEYINCNEGAIFWAGAEYDHLFRGTLEGAVRSGRNAADRILGI